MIRHLARSLVILCLLAGSVRAELPKGFDWDDDAVAAVAANHPEQLDAATPEERARIVGLLIGEHGAHASSLTVLSRAPALDRWRTLRILDRSNDTTVRHVYDSLDSTGQAKLFDLVNDAGAAASAAGLQQIGVVSDCDDTAFPTQFTPDGPYSFKGSGDFYRLVAFGTDGKGDPGNLHFVTARMPVFFPNSRQRLKAAGVPVGTFDGDKSFKRFAFGGLDGIEQSKEENLDLWFRLHPGQRFVLLGDTLQRDPEVYRWALQHHADQVELVLIHKAGGPVRNPADYQGEVFFDDYIQAQKIVRDRGIVRPGALLPPPIDAAGLPPPSTDVSKETAAEKKEGFWGKVKDFFKENVGSLTKHPPAPSKPTTGISGTLPGGS
jgi:hypothetical protein